MAFESNRSGAEEIWVAGSDSTEPVQLTHLGGFCGSPRWSPDGRWIAFDAHMGKGWEIWKVESTGGTPLRLSAGTGSSVAPVFSHDGKWIYFGNNRTGRQEIFRIPIEGGNAAQLTSNGCAYSLESVDGRTIYCLKDSTESGSALYEVPLAGGPQRSLGVYVPYRAFQVMMDGIYFITPSGANGRGREIRFYDFATRRSRTIQDLGEVTTFLGLSASPDRKSFLYSVLEGSGRDLMLVENFR